jgi:ubiquitin-conjugating enzyme E2 Z
MDNNTEKTKTITKETLSRLMKDVREIIKNPLTSHGIYYKHDEDDMLKGAAMIVGPEETPYFGGFYFFTFDFPSDYPHSPPLVTYCTNGDNIRFNPNLYKDGKVCISLLNTWRGEQWTSCQTLSTVLLNLCTLLNNEPLLNEPGASKKHPDFLVYNKIIEYKNVDIAILKMIQKLSPFYNPLFDGFDDILKEIFIKNAEVIKDDLEKKKKRVTEYLQTNYYKMVVKLDYAKLYKDFMDVYNMIHGIETKTIEEENIVVEKKKTTKKKVWKFVEIVKN